MTLLPRSYETVMVTVYVTVMCTFASGDLSTLQVKGDLNERRAAITRKAFEIMDRDHSGFITLDDIKAVYNVLKHPDVISGRFTADKVFSDFLQSFEGSAGNKDGKVTVAEFLDYYADIGSSIPSDDYFCEMMESCWMITELPASADVEAKLTEWVGVLREKVRQKTTAGGSEALKLRQVFQFFDSDESGVVTIDEFGRAVERLGLPLQRRETSLFFAKFDPDNSGTITYDEFVKYVYGE